MQVGKAIGDDPAGYADPDNGRARMALALKDKVCLIVLDDIWDVAHAEPFLNSLGPRCRLLLTTRDGGLVTALGAQAHRIDTLNDEAAIKLLASWSEQLIETLPPEAAAVARECGNLPFTIAQCGAMARDGVLWKDLLTALRDADVSFIARKLPNYPFPDALV